MCQITIESLTTFCVTALTKVGMSRVDAETTANALVLLPSTSGRTMGAGR